MLIGLTGSSLGSGELRAAENSRLEGIVHDPSGASVPQAEVVIGVPGYLLPEENRFFRLVTMPVVRQRPYWRWPSGKAPRRVYPPAFPHPGTMLE